MKNPVAEFARKENLSITELAVKLRISTGFAHDLVNGRKSMGMKTAKRLAAVTKRDWWEYLNQ